MPVPTPIPTPPSPTPTPPTPTPTYSGIMFGGFLDGGHGGCECCQTPTPTPTPPCYPPMPICAYLCNEPYPGVSITVKDSNGNVVASGMTGPDGCFYASIPPGSYYVTAGPPIGMGCTTNLTNLTCLGTTINFGRFGACGCLGLLITEEPVTFVIPGVGTFATDSTGYTDPICFYNINLIGIVISAGRFSTVTVTTEFGQLYPPLCALPCTVFSLISLVAEGFHCSGCCNMPVCDTLDGTDAILGVVTLDWYAPGVGLNTGIYPQWIGILNYTYEGSCGCPDATIPVTYYWPVSGVISGGGTDCRIGVSIPAAGVSDHGCSECAGLWGCPSSSITDPSIGFTTGTIVDCFPLDVSGVVGPIDNQCKTDPFDPANTCGCGVFCGSCVTSIWGTGPATSTTLTLTDLC